MDIHIKNEDILNLKADALVIPLFKSSKVTDRQLDNALDGALSNLLKEDILDEGNMTALFTNKKIKAKNVLIVGLGEKKKFKRDTLRKVAGSLVKHCKANKLNHISVLYDFKKNQTEDFVEGMILGDYSFDKYKTKKDEDKNKELKNVVLLVKNKQEEKRLGKEMLRGSTIAHATNFARDLINQPAITATPEYMAKMAKELAKLPNVTCTVLDVNDIKKEKMGLLLGVAAGSPNPPKLVVLHYNKAEKRPTVLVGKGVTFDSGGTNLKPAGYMEGMKDDMGGAAAVFGAVKAAAELKLPVNLYGIVPLTENLIGGQAIKPDDILTSGSGKTVEIANTDAEGRLILADALNYALRYKPAEMIDIATLTGAAVVALGCKVACVMGTDKTLVKKLVVASEEVAEPIWELPLWDLYAEDVKSSVADVKNLGKPKGEAGTIAGGMFLKEFVGDVKWAHIDIGATVNSPDGTGYFAQGARGFGVRLFIEYLTGRRK